MQKTHGTFETLTDLAEMAKLPSFLMVVYPPHKKPTPRQSLANEVAEIERGLLERNKAWRERHVAAANADLNIAPKVDPSTYVKEQPAVALYRVAEETRDRPVTHRTFDRETYDKVMRCREDERRRALNAELDRQERAQWDPRENEECPCQACKDARETDQAEADGVVLDFGALGLVYVEWNDTFDEDEDEEDRCFFRPECGCPGQCERR